MYILRIIVDFINWYRHLFICFQITQLEEANAQKEGEIQRLNRHVTRVGKDLKSITNGEVELDEESSELTTVILYV